MILFFVVVLSQKETFTSTELLAGGELETFEVHTLHVTEALLHFREAALFTDETVYFQAYFSSLNTDHHAAAIANIAISFSIIMFLFLLETVGRE